MHIEFSPADAAYIKQAVINGYYPSEEEAVKAAVRIVREETEAKRQQLLAALAEGDADIEAGRVFDYTPEFMDEIFAEAKSLVGSGNKIVYDANVIPSVHD
jgi:putative addiction module CopG family antidote